MKPTPHLLLLSLFLALTLADITNFRSSKTGFQYHPHPFGATFQKKETFVGSESIVEFPRNGLFSDPDHYRQLYASWLQNQQNPAEFLQAQKQANLECSREGGSAAFKVLPAYIGALTPENSTVKYSAPCFQENEISLSIVDEETIQLVHTVKNASSLLCTDGYLYSSLINYHVDAIAIRGKHVVTFKLSPTDLEHVKKTGISIFRLCDKTINFIPNLLKTLALFTGGLGLNPNLPFIGGKPTEAQTKANIDFIYEANGYQWLERPKEAHKAVVQLDESLLQSGDFIAITRFDGLDQIIQWGTGSTAGHCVMVLKVKGEAYVVESQDAWYWPRNKIQINPYKIWVKWAENAGFHVTWLPLKKEFAKKFDSDAAYKFFRSIEGVPYGYHNFLFGYVDTPQNTFPSLLAPEFLPAAFAILEKTQPEAAQSVFGMPLNMRLGTVNLTIPEIAYEAAMRNTTIPDLMAIPEIDGWQYADGVSYVCSSLVVAMWKAGGLFGDLEVNAVEFTPRDLYELEFLDPNPVVPENCKKIDPENKFCQIMGKYRMEFPTIGIRKPYARMNERCHSEPPLYERYPPNC